ncbi:hypothetical protein M413DRAFT_443017 [Hebeloma cylindrosporum]|uniref:Uncharacterized protein n=1 Tax=Hebeloma cylindrosporum TaxID=76867 RepID=A0A0C2YSC5_HEBCY|nr:hypothetical protein M413DRAFT_443017 [Hebeloma cylindrosporum h7]
MEPHEPAIQITGDLIAFYYFSNSHSARNEAYYIEHSASAFAHTCLLGLLISGRSCQVPAFAMFVVFREDVGPLTHMNSDP